MKLSSTSMEPDALKIVTADLERVLYRITPAELRRLEQSLPSPPKTPSQDCFTRLCAPGKRPHSTTNGRDEN